MKPISVDGRPTLLRWPRDEAAHLDFPWEVWWVTAEVESVAGRRFAAHFMASHTAGRMMRIHVSLREMDDGPLLSRHLKSASAVAGIATDRLSLRAPLGSFYGSFADGYRVAGDLEGSGGFDLALDPASPVLLNGGAGSFLLGEAVTTQYSVPGLRVSGKILIGRESHQVEGSAWYDRQWIRHGRFSDTGGAFAWFGVVLTDGRAVSLWDTSVRPGGGSTWATVLQPDGTHIVTTAETEVIGGEAISSESGQTIPHGWVLSMPGIDARLQVRHRLAQESSRTFYTGVLEVTGTVAGDSVQGRGFCDLVG